MKDYYFKPYFLLTYLLVSFPYFKYSINKKKLIYHISVGNSGITDLDNVQSL